jgi:hypothetical protein
MFPIMFSLFIFILTTIETSKLLSLVFAVGLMVIEIGFLRAIYYARRELNGWGYFIAAICAISVGALWPLIWTHASQKMDVASLGVLFLIEAPLIFGLIDYGRLALSGRNGLSILPLRLANAVSKLLRHRRSLVPSVHVPTDPGRSLFTRSCLCHRLWVFSS